MDKNYQIFLGRYQQFIGDLADGCVDAVITDPPYGTTNLDFDLEFFDILEFWREVYRVLKPNGIVAVHSQQPFTTDMINSNRKDFFYEIVWCKPSGFGFLDVKFRPLRAHENVLIFCRKKKSMTYNPQFVRGNPQGFRKRGGNAISHYRAKHTMPGEDFARQPTISAGLATFQPRP